MAGAQVRRLVAVLRAPTGSRVSQQEAAARGSKDDALASSCSQLTLLLQNAPERTALFLAGEGPLALLELLDSTSSKVRQAVQRVDPQVAVDAQANDAGLSILHSLRS